MMQSSAPNPEIERASAEKYLLTSGRDFAATYMTVANLQYLAREHPDIFTTRTILSLKQVLTSTNHSAQRQSYFLYRKAADALNGLIVSTANSDMASIAGRTLFSILGETDGPAFQASCEALGALPVQVPDVEKPDTRAYRIARVEWTRLLQKAGVKNSVRPALKGRNVVLPMPDKGGLLVIKTGTCESDVPNLANETGWMRKLQKRTAADGDRRCMRRVPQPIRIDGTDVFQVSGIPAWSPGGKGTEQSRFAAAFITDPGYFTYPNEAIDHPLPEKARMHAMLSRNAWLLGHFAGFGIIHTAPIPLFHNRVQMHRRTDGGLYEWHRGGRLDRWLESCRYPNVGETGLRDFEHFEVFSGRPRQLYYRLGSHLFSLILIAGSYFRAKAPNRAGWDRNGAPVDVRHLFDAGLMRRLVHDIFSNYFEGFTGAAPEVPLPIDTEAFVDRLIDEMGVDRHMTEVLRITDQNDMNKAEFAAFLSQRGFSTGQIAQLEKGKSDISIPTGPHLGDFNDRISLPELIEFTSAAAAVCIAGKFYADTFASAILKDNRFAL